MTDMDDIKSLITAADPLKQEPGLAARTADEVVLARARLAMQSSDAGRDGGRRWRNQAMWSAAASVVAVLLATSYALMSDEAGEPAPKPLFLTGPAPNPNLLCTGPDADGLRTQTMAFAGTAVSVEPGIVRFRVDHWYKGQHDGDVVLRTLTGPDKIEYGTYELTEGERYVIAASGGHVANCFDTGFATPEMLALYEEAFSGGHEAPRTP